MIVTRDHCVDAAHLALTDEPIASTEELSDGLVIDLDEAGALVGVEVLSFSHGWSSSELCERFDLDTDTVATMHSLVGPHTVAQAIASRA